MVASGLNQAFQMRVLNDFSLRHDHLELNLELRAYGKSSSSIDYGNYSISMLGLLHILIAIIYRKTTYQPMVSFRRAQSFVSRINNCVFIC